MKSGYVSGDASAFRDFFLLSRLLEIYRLHCGCAWVCVRSRRTYACVQRQGEFGRRTKTRTETEHEERKRTQKVQNRGGAREKKKGGKWNGSGDDLDKETWVRTSEWGMALCLEERSSCASKRRKTKERERKREGEFVREKEREREREREGAAPRGSIHHTSGGVIRTWEEGFLKCGLQRDRARTLPKIRGIETDEITALSLAKCRTRPKGEKGNIIINSGSSGSAETLEGKTTRTGDDTTAVLVTGLLVFVCVCEEVFCCRYSTPVKGATHRIKPNRLQWRAALCHIN